MLFKQLAFFCLEIVQLCSHFGRASGSGSVGSGASFPASVTSSSSGAIAYGQRILSPSVVSSNASFLNTGGGSNYFGDAGGGLSFGGMRASDDSDVVVQKPFFSPAKPAQGSGSGGGAGDISGDASSRRSGVFTDMNLEELASMFVSFFVLSHIIYPLCNHSAHIP